MADKKYGWKPAILFASKDRVPSKIQVPFRKHRVATFPKIYKTESGAMNFAKGKIEKEPGVWQLPAAKRVKI